MSAVAGKPAIIGAAVTAWHDAFDALRSMTVVAGIGFLLMLAVTAAEYQVLPPDGGASSWGRQLTAFAIAIMESFLLTPLAIAVHRYVLLGEITQRYSLDPSSPRFRRFFGLVAAFYVLLWLPLWIVEGLSEIEKLRFSEGLRFLAFFLFLVLLILMIRTLILFAAIAVDAPGVSWGNALLDSKGHAWRMFFIALVTGLPMFVVMILGVALLILLPGWSVFAIVVAIQAVISLFLIATMAALASRLYATFANRLGRPPGLQAAGPSPA